jgi:hypothetical protein
LNSSLAFCLSFICIGHMLRNPCPFWISFIFAACHNSKKGSQLCSHYHNFTQHNYCRPSFLLCCCQSHLPAKLGSPTTTIFGRATYWPTLCIKITSHYIFICLLYRDVCICRLYILSTLCALS